MNTDYSEQGTAISGYAEEGPYHCGDCVHRVNATSNVCVHPVVVHDPKLASKKVETLRGVRVNLSRGCCRFVRVSPHPLKALREKE